MSAPRPIRVVTPRLRRLVARPPEVEQAVVDGTLTREQAQGRGVRGARKRTVNAKALAGEGERVHLTVLNVDRPATRGECENVERPCPWVGCKWHTFLDVNEDTGSIVLNFPDVDPEALDRLPYTCALDMADHGGAMLEDIGAVMNLTRERVRQIEAAALVQLRGHPALRDEGIDR